MCIYLEEMRRTGKHTDSTNTLTTSTTYRALFRENPIIFALMIGFGAMCMWLSFLPTNDPRLVTLGFRAFGVLLIFLPWIIRARFYVIIDPQGISARGFFKPHRVEWIELGEVIAIGQGHDFYGPDTYKLQGARDAMILNLKFFPRECSVVLFRQIEWLGITITYPREI